MTVDPARLSQAQATFNASDADLSEAGMQAASEFRALRPEVSDEAVDALAWCYTYDWK